MLLPMRMKYSQQNLRPFGLMLVLLLAGLSQASAADAKPAVRHPNLLLNREEIEQIKEKVRQHKWAAQLLAQVRVLADDKSRIGRIPREAALVYVLTGERSYGQAARRSLVENARSSLASLEKYDPRFDSNLSPSWGPWATWAWTYDLTYDLYTGAEREQVERMFRRAAQAIMDGLKVKSTTPNLVFEMHWKVGLIGYVLGDKELIEWGLNDPGKYGPTHGGFYQVLDAMVKDRHFWGEAPIYALHFDVHGMLALAEAALHYDGTDLYGYVSRKSGASIKNLIDGYLRLAFPREKTGIEGGSVRMATFGDGSTTYSHRGDLLDTFLVNPVSGAFGDVTLSGELEIAYKRYKDPGYAWLLSLNPKRDQYIGSPGQGYWRPVWGYVGLTHGEPLPEKITPPPAPCGVYPSQGFAMLRSDESPRYWDGGTAAVLRLGTSVGHGHKDYFHLILHGKGRLLYPDLNVIQYEPGYLQWTHEGIAHNTLLVDHQSPRPAPFTTRQDFSPESKFFAITGSAFADVTQMRALLLTPEYMTDVFHARDLQGRERTFDWVTHGLGRLYPGNPAAYRPSSSLVPFYAWVDNERSRQTDGGWQVDWVQQSAGVAPGLQHFGREWFQQTVGVRLTMLGVSGTEVHVGDGPITNGPPHHRLDGDPEGSSPLVVARRRAAATTFSAVHEPYEHHSNLKQVRKIQETERAVGLAVEGTGFSDRILVAFEAEREHTLRGADGEVFAFQDHGYLRRAGDRLMVRGRVRAFQLRAPGVSKLTINGQDQEARQEGDFLVFGDVPARDGAVARLLEDEPCEHRAALHYYLMPEEVHLHAGEAKEAALCVRCVGRGKAQGSLRFQAPKDITVEPEAVDFGRLEEGESKVVRLRFKAAAGAAAALRPVRVVPDGETPAAAGVLMVSVGVVLTEDRRVPMSAQWVVRAPGYTVKVDQYSGLTHYLLDADGNRRFGPIYNTDFAYGLGALQRGGKWLLRYGSPARFVWDGKNSITVGVEGENLDARLRYTFHPDLFVLGLIPPTKPKLTQTMWLGNFDSLGPMRHGGIPKKPNDPLSSKWFFFPHPRHRQGLLVSFPQPLAIQQQGGSLNFPLTVGQEATVRFATEEELEELLKRKQSQSGAAK